MSKKPTTSEERVSLSLEGQEARQRLASLRALIRDEQRRHRLLFRAGLGGIAAVAVTAQLTYIVQTLPLDVAASRGLQSIPFSPFRQLMYAVSAIGFFPYSAFAIGTSCLLVGLLLGVRDAAYLAALSLFQGLVTTSIKWAVGRPRPVDTLVEVLLPAGGKSFPSGHVMFYTVLFGFLFFLALIRLPRSPWRTLALVVTGGLVLLVGPSRMFLGAHWLSDVFAGHVLAFIILGFAIEFYLKYVAPRRRAEEGGLIGAHDQAV